MPVQRAGVSVQAVSSRFPWIAMYIGAFPLVLEAAAEASQ